MTNEPAGVRADRGQGVDASARAQELRATLGAIVEEAQQLSEQLVAESREAAATTTREAQDRADGILARARSDAEQITEQARAAADAVRAQAEAEVEEHRRRVRAEVTEQVTREVTERSHRELARVRAQSHAVIGDLEASVRILGVSLESAVSNITEMLSALESLRSHLVDPEADPLDAVVVARVVDTTAAPAVEPTLDPVDDESPQPGQAVDQPAFGAAQAPPRSVPAAPSVFDEAGSEATADAQPGATKQRRPLTATEAFLLSSRLEDPAEGSRYEPARVREERAAPHEETAGGASGESRRGADEAEGDEPGKPLGWLFRSPH